MSYPRNFNNFIFLNRQSLFNIHKDDLFPVEIIDTLIFNLESIV